MNVKLVRVGIEEAEFLWKMQEWTDWTLTESATNAIYEKYQNFNDITRKLFN